MRSLTSSQFGPARADYMRRARSVLGTETSSSVGLGMHKGKRLLFAVPARCGARARTDDHRPRDDRARHDLDEQRADGALVHPRVEADADIELWPEPEQRADVRVQAGQGRVQAGSHRREPLCVVIRSLFASDGTWRVLMLLFCMFPVCTGTAQAYFQGSKFAQLSETYGYVVLFPSSVSLFFRVRSAPHCSGTRNTPSRTQAPAGTSPPTRRSRTTAAETLKASRPPRASQSRTGASTQRASSPSARPRAR